MAADLQRIAGKWLALERRTDVPDRSGLVGEGHHDGAHHNWTPGRSGATFSYQQLAGQISTITSDGT